MAAAATSIAPSRDELRGPAVADVVLTAGRRPSLVNNISRNEIKGTTAQLGDKSSAQTVDNVKGESKSADDPEKVPRSHSEQFETSDKDRDGNGTADAAFLKQVKEFFALAAKAKQEEEYVYLPYCQAHDLETGVWV